MRQYYAKGKTVEKKKLGKKMRAKGAKGAPTEEAIKKSQA